VRAIVHNLQKKPEVFLELLSGHCPDIVLAQEVTDGLPLDAANVSSLGYGTGIYSTTDVTNIKRINSPHAEFIPTMRKKTTIGTSHGVEWVSFHGYNGTPFRSAKKLTAHVRAALQALGSGPCVFAGDFNTWSQTHFESVKFEMIKHGFTGHYSAPYKDRPLALDHVFVRGLWIESAYYYETASDHPCLEVVLRA